ncbi:hypothetical protein ACFL6C_05410 [Myxococcota bacterium]
MCRLIFVFVAFVFFALPAEAGRHRHTPDCLCSHKGPTWYIYTLPVWNPNDQELELWTVDLPNREVSVLAFGHAEIGMYRFTMVVDESIKDPMIIGFTWKGDLAPAPKTRCQIRMQEVKQHKKIEVVGVECRAGNEDQVFRRLASEQEAEMGWFSGRAFQRFKMKAHVAAGN